MMKFFIEIRGETHPQLLAALDYAREQLIRGGAHLNVGGSIDVVMRPADTASEREFYRLYEDAHPIPKAAWTRK